MLNTKGPCAFREGSVENSDCHVETFNDNQWVSRRDCSPDLIRKQIDDGTLIQRKSSVNNPLNHLVLIVGDAGTCTSQPRKKQDETAVAFAGRERDEERVTINNHGTEDDAPNLWRISRAPGTIRHEIKMLEDVALRRSETHGKTKLCNVAVNGLRPTLAM